jgi:flagellar hook-associated protein 1 FlgK
VDGFYRNFIDTMATRTHTAMGYLATSLEEMNFLDNRRMQISGVSLEEEMSNMIRFQHAYNASARMINTLDSMMDRIINQTGRVGL